MKYAVSAVALAAALGFAGVAHAGGSLKDTPVEPVYHAPIWEGVYFGGFGGYAWTDAEYDKPSKSGSELFDFDLDGGLVGGQIGYDFQRGDYVFGIVGDYSRLTADDTYLHGPDGEQFSHEVDLESIATLRGRIGYAFDDMLIYGTAGAAFVSVNLDACSGKPNSPRGCDPKDDLDDDYTTWAVGAGLEKQLSHGISLFAEYLHLGDGEVGPDDEKDWEDEVEFDGVDVIKVGVNFKIGGMRHEEPLK